jgi:photosystem II stability/assembly factor-like uncharacterized protein
MKQKNRRFASSKPRFLISTILLFCLAISTFGGGGNKIIPSSDPVKISVWDVVGPSGGDVRVVTIDPKDKNHLFVSTLDGSIHNSTDGGKTWNLLVNLNKPQLVLDQLLIDSRDSNLIYTSGHRHKEPGGFFMTKDGGVTWKEAKELRKTSIHSMEQSVKNPNIILVGTTDGMWRTENSGDDWKKIESATMPDTTIDSIAIDPRDDDTIYAGTWWRAYKTTDGGKNWRLIKNGLIDDSDVFAIEIDQKNPDHIIASACSGIYESFNKAEKWAKVQGIPSQSRRTRDIKMNPTNSNIVYAATTEGFWMKTGKGWIITTQKDLEINSIAVHPDAPERIFIGTNNYGVMVSNDGGRNFAPTNDNFTSRFAYTITADIEQPNRLYATTHNTATGGGFFFISNDGGTTWIRPKNFDVVRVSPFGMIQDRVNPNTIYMATNLGMFKSLDRGNAWTQIVPPKPKPAPKSKKNAVAKKTTAPVTKPEPIPTPALAATGPVVVPALAEKVKVLAYTEDGKNGFFAGTDKGLYRSYDLSKGWEKVPFGDGFSENVYVIHSSPLIPGVIWVGTERSGVIVSRDDGKTWDKISGIPQDVPISSIVADPKRPENIYVGTTQTFYLSRDGGRSWARRGGNLPLGNYTSILISPNNSDEIFISSALESDGGIYYSKDAGQNWKRVDSKEMKLPSRRVWSMIFDPSNPSRIFAATHSSGIYRIDREPITASNESGTRPRVSTTGN